MEWNWRMKKRPLIPVVSSTNYIVSTHLMILTITLIATIMYCVVGAPMEELVDELPGQSSTMGMGSAGVEVGTGFKQYAGYITVDEAKGTNFFYYFTEAHQHHKPNASASNNSLPIALWLNGGPGCSSVGVGGFSELGPFYPNRTGDGLRVNPYSWNKIANLLFLESPAGVGFSYSLHQDYTYNDWKVARHNLIFMRKWLEKFPEYRDSPLVIVGESYAGHYIPQLASLMVKSQEFNLKGILMGNPLLNYAVDSIATYSFLWSHGMISDTTYSGISTFCDFRYGFMGGEKKLLHQKNHHRHHLNNTIEGSVKKNQSILKEVTDKNREECVSFMGSASEEMGSYINIYDVTADVCSPSIINQAILLHKLMGLGGDETTLKIDACVDGEVIHYLNQPSVQKALHANVHFNPYAWEACSRIVDYRDSDHQMDMSPILAHLVKNQLAVWLYSGDQDSVVPLTGTRSLVGQLAQQLKMKPKGPYRPWFSHGQVGGWYQAYGDGRLMYATVRGASHMVPYAQPQRALLLFASFLGGMPLPSHP